jgi:hypothetical protein
MNTRIAAGENIDPPAELRAKAETGDASALVLAGEIDESGICSPADPTSARRNCRQTTRSADTSAVFSVVRSWEIRWNAATTERDKARVAGLVLEPEQARHRPPSALNAGVWAAAQGAAERADCPNRPAGRLIGIAGILVRKAEII